MADVVQMSVSCKAQTQRKSCSERCFCRKSSNHSQHQSPFSRLRLIVQLHHGPNCSAAGTRVFLRHASSKKVCRRSTSTLGAELLNLSRFRTKVAPIVVEAKCDTKGKPPGVCTIIHRNTNPCRLMSHILRACFWESGPVFCWEPNCTRLRSCGVTPSLNHKNAITSTSKFP